MSEYKKAKLAFLTEPSKGVVLIYLDDGKKHMQVELSGDQLANLISDGARMKFQTGGR